jgi:hypothetical protein
MGSRRPAATRTAWQNQPMPEVKTRLPLGGQFTPDEQRRIAHGLVPEEMEDKWFIFYEDGWLHLHRSWTGLCVYVVKLRPTADGGSELEEAWVNRDPAQYKETDQARDAAMLAYLIERLLLGRNVPFPGGGAGLQSQLLRHHLVGYARSNDED